MDNREHKNFVHTTAKSFQEQSNNEDIISKEQSVKWHSILEQDINIEIKMDVMHSKNISLHFDPEQEDGIPLREEQKVLQKPSRRDSMRESMNDSNDLGESGENYMDRSQDSMPDFSHLQQ